MVSSTQLRARAAEESGDCSPAESDSHAIAHRPAHIAIGTGSTAARNDINANFPLSYQPTNKTSVALLHPSVATQLMESVGYAENTANPLWLALQDSGKVVAALRSRWT